MIADADISRFGRHHLGNRSGWWWEGGDQKGGWLGGREGRLEVIRHECYTS